MSLYEHVFIARQDLAPTQVEALGDQFAGIITANGGEIQKREYWGLRSLSYRIKKNKKGHYVLLGIEAPSAALKEMERLMSLNSDILRHITVSVEKISKDPSPAMQSGDDSYASRRPRGNDRDGGGGNFRGGDRPRRFNNDAVAAEGTNG